jgi:hypothetical protein
MPSYEKFRLLGLCITCGDQRAPGRVRCQSCLEKIAASGRASNQKRKASGICLACGKLNDNLPRQLCFSCIQDRAITRKRGRLGLCLTCGEKPEHGKKRCAQCLAKVTSCIDCGGQRKPGRVRCESCLKILSDRSAENIKRAKVDGKCYGCKKPNDNLPKANCLACTNLARDRRIRLKLEVFQAYGGAFCACCGEKILEFLTLDHIENNGARHRRDYAEKTKRVKPFGQAMLRILRDQGFPPGYQVLCWNCNCGKGLYGKCPHEIYRNSN